MKLLTAGTRPASLYHKGCEVRIDVHDAFFQRIHSLFLADLLAYHPDTRLQHGHRRRKPMYKLKHYKAKGFIRVNRRYQTWLVVEREWYARFGMVPPKGKIIAVRDSMIADLKYKAPCRLRNSATVFAPKRRIFTLGPSSLDTQQIKPQQKKKRILRGIYNSYTQRQSRLIRMMP